MASSSFTNFSGQTLLVSPGIVREIAATVAGQTITAVSGAEQLKDVAGGDTLVGSAGDNTYIIVDSSTKIIEKAGGGTDTVVSYTNYVLPDNVENITLSQDHRTIAGNSAANILTTTVSNARIIGGGGNDVIVNQGGGASTFVYAPGADKDVIIGFHATGAMHDSISVSGYGLNSFADVQSHLTQQGADALLTLSSTDAILLKNTQVSDLSAQDFLLPLNLGGMKMTFDDEFNSLSLYNAQTGQGTWKTNYDSGVQSASGPQAFSSRTLVGNGEKEVYVDPSYAGTGSKALGLNPFSINNGVLSITAQKTPDALVSTLNGYQYTSGMLTTSKSFSQEYGYFEMRAQLPTGQGQWPAFWLLPTSGQGPAELDVMEAVGGNTVYSTTHTGQSGKDSPTQFAVNVDNLGGGYHTFGLLWTATEVDYYIDGQEVGSMATPADMHQQMYMLVNLAIGGSWPGDPAKNFTSAQMNIDYIHAYSLPSTITAQAASKAASAPVTETVHTATSATDQTLNGADKVLSGFSYSLAGTTAHSLTLTGTANIDATGNGLGDTLTGNTGANHLTGGAGNDTLTGGGGLDTLAGGAGDDTYYVSDSRTVITEAAGGGNDVVYSSASYTLPANVEHMILTGSASLTAKGNDTGSWISGNNGPDTLIGGAGNDFLHGGAFADVLNGMTGNDTLTGGAGNDTFVVTPGSKTVISDFDAQGDHDVLDISAYLAAGYKAKPVDVATGVVITFYGLSDVIQLSGMHVSGLTATATGYHG